MIKINNSADCCGCSACASICASSAITMVPDKMGFLYPQVDVQKCVDCGLCEKVCSFNANYDVKDNLETPIAYGARHKNMHEVETSRSGAVSLRFPIIFWNRGALFMGQAMQTIFESFIKGRRTRKSVMNLKEVSMCKVT